jgi:uncharacterized MAPEG superfamily protein
MTTELWCLVAASLWTIALNYLPLLGRVAEVGMKWGFGNRHDPPAGKAWVQRADRAQRNHLENLPIFAVLVLCGQVTGHHDRTTDIAAVVFLAARLAHSLLYVAGIVVARTIAFWTSLGAMAWLLFKLL